MIVSWPLSRREVVNLLPSIYTALDFVVLSALGPIFISLFSRTDGTKNDSWPA